MFSSNQSQVSNDAVFIEDTFSCTLYTGNGSTQTITNGIDLSGEGGLVWIKDRSQGTGYHHILQDTARGASWCLFSNLTNAQSQDSAGTDFAFNSNGFYIGSSNVKINGTDNYASWTFRKQPKFFDVVTWTGNGATNRQISHALGSTPGCIMVKRTDSSSYNWYVYHRSLGTNGSYPNYLYLNTTDAENGGFYAWFSGAPTSTDFSVGYYSGTGGGASLNVNGATYVAYLFAHNAGGFGLTGTDNVISCGSFTGNGSANGPTVDLGYEPQWLMIKKTGGSGGAWWIVDNMRGFSVTSDQFLWANSSTNEIPKTNYVKPTATGFQIVNTDFDVNEAGEQYIYIAIRRGPMKVPTDGTSVFNAFAGADTSAITTNFPVDFFIENARVLNSANSATGARLLGGDVALVTSSTAATQTGFFSTTWYQSNTSYLPGCFGTAVAYAYRRAPSFFDEVCYTGTGSATTQTHNLGVVPELMIVKSRSNAYAWVAYCKYVDATLPADYYLVLNSTNARTGPVSAMWNQTAPTASVFTVKNDNEVNASGATYVAYLFASCPGVSKVGSYTGNGSTQTIDCGFAGGARFVLIKRTDSTGDWYVYDTARGMTTLTDPYLLLNSTAAETATLGSVTTVSTGFAVNASILAAINTNAATYIYLAIA